MNRRQAFLERKAAATVQGLGAAGIEAIAAAGLTRGAFYSNFADKDELVIAMLEDHVDRSIQHHRELLAQHRTPETSSQRSLPRTATAAIRWVARRCCISS